MEEVLVSGSGIIPADKIATTMPFGKIHPPTFLGWHLQLYKLGSCAIITDKDNGHGRLPKGEPLSNMHVTYEMT